MLTIDIFKLYKETETDIMSCPFSASLKKKLDGKISSIEEIEDMKLFQVQRECSEKFTKVDRAELQTEINKFRIEEKSLAEVADQDKVVQNMIGWARDYCKSKYSGLYKIYIETTKGDAIELESLIYHLSIVDGRRCLRALLRSNGFSSEEIAFVMCNYALCRVIY